MTPASPKASSLIAVSAAAAAAATDTEQEQHQHQAMMTTDDDSKTAKMKMKMMMMKKKKSKKRNNKRTSPFRIKVGCVVALRYDTSSSRPILPIPILVPSNRVMIVGEDHHYHSPSEQQQQQLRDMDGRDRQSSKVLFSASSSSSYERPKVTTTDDVVRQYKWMEVWSDPQPNQDEGWALIGKHIRCGFPKSVLLLQQEQQQQQQQPKQGSDCSTTKTKTTTPSWERVVEGEVVGIDDMFQLHYHHHHHQTVHLLVDRSVLVTMPYLERLLLPGRPNELLLDENCNNVLLSSPSLTSSSSASNNHNNKISATERQRQLYEERIRGRNKVTIRIRLAPIVVISGNDDDDDQQQQQQQHQTNTMMMMKKKKSDGDGSNNNNNNNSDRSNSLPVAKWTVRKRVRMMGVVPSSTAITTSTQSTTTSSSSSPSSTAVIGTQIGGTQTDDVKDDNNNKANISSSSSSSNSSSNQQGTVDDNNGNGSKGTVKAVHSDINGGTIAAARRSFSSKSTTAKDHHATPAPEPKNATKVEIPLLTTTLLSTVEVMPMKSIYIGNKYDSDKQQERNWRWMSAKFPYHLLVPPEKIYSDDKDDDDEDDFEQRRLIESGYFIGQVVKIQVQSSSASSDKNGSHDKKNGTEHGSSSTWSGPSSSSSSLAQVTVRRLLLPEHTPMGRLPHHKWNEILECSVRNSSNHQQHGRNNSLAAIQHYQIPIESLVMISRSLERRPTSQLQAEKKKMKKMKQLMTDRHEGIEQVSGKESRSASSLGGEESRDAVPDDHHTSTTTTAFVSFQYNSSEQSFDPLIIPDKIDVGEKHHREDEGTSVKPINGSTQGLSLTCHRCRRRVRVSEKDNKSHKGGKSLEAAATTTTTTTTAAEHLCEECVAVIRPFRKLQGTRQRDACDCPTCTARLSSSLCDRFEENVFDLEPGELSSSEACRVCGRICKTGVRCDGECDAVMHKRCFAWGRLLATTDINSANGAAAQINGVNKKIQKICRRCVDDESETSTNGVSNSHKRVSDIVVKKLRRIVPTDFDLDPKLLFVDGGLPRPSVRPITSIKPRTKGTNRKKSDTISNGRSKSPTPQSSGKRRRVKSPTPGSIEGISKSANGSLTRQLSEENQFQPTSCRLLPYDPIKKQVSGFKKQRITSPSSTHSPDMMRYHRSMEDLTDNEKKKETSGRAARANQRRVMKGVAALKKSTSLLSSSSAAQRSNVGVGGGAGNSVALELDALVGRESQLRFDRSSIHAWGVFADQSITAGEMIVEYRGEIIGNAMAEKREREYHEAKIGSDYMFRVDANTVCDATKQGNVARFLNASCDPNCYTQIITINGTKRIVIYAKKDIRVGDELCYDYKFPMEFNESKRIPCHCGAKECRGFMNWDKKYVSLPAPESVQE